MKTNPLGLFPVLLLAGGLTAQAQYSGVINDPDGYVNVRKEQSAKASIITKIQEGEVFEFEESEGSPWWKVTTDSGKEGWVYFDRIRFHLTDDDLFNGGEGDELTLYGQSKGVEYFKLSRKAAAGDPESLARYLSLGDADGAAGESHAHQFNTVLHALGDEKLAAFLKSQPVQLQINVRNQWLNEVALWPFEPFGYVERNFPKTGEILLKKEIVSWQSPNGKYAILKMFSDAAARESSTVEKAQIINKTTGGVLADFSDQDTGFGASREGLALWSKDSKLVAIFTGDLYQQADLQVFGQSKGELFRKVALPVSASHEIKGRADAELTGAKHIFGRTQPLKWTGNTLSIQRHDYYEKEGPADSGIQGIGRTMLWEVEFEDGKSRLVKVEEINFEDEEGQ